MIRTSELARTALCIGHHCGGMVTAHIEEPPELLVLTANDNNRLAAGKLAGNVMTGCLKLI